MNKFIKSQIFLFIVFTALFFTADANAASLILGVAGAAVGSIFGGVGAQIGWLAGAMIGNMLFGPKGQNKEGPRLNDLKVQTNTVGVAIPNVWGTVLMSGNLIWCPGFTEHKHEEKQGKGMGGGSSYTSYTYTVSCAIGLCCGTIYGIRRIFANEKLVYDASTGNEGATGEFRKYMRIYKGTEEQMPDPLMQQVYKDYTPAYRGLAYVVLQDLPLEDYGNQIPSLKFEVIFTPDDVGQDSYGVKTSTYSYNGQNYPSGQIEVNQYNGYLYRFSRNNPNTYSPYLIEKINPNNYKVEKSALIPSTTNTFPGGNSYQNYLTQKYPNGNMFYPFYSNGINIVSIDPNTLQATTKNIKDVCQINEQGKWVGPYADFLNLGVNNIYCINTPENSNTSYYVSASGNDNFYYKGMINTGSGTAIKVNLPPNRIFNPLFPTAVKQDGSIYFVTLEGISQKYNTFLNCSNGQHDILQLTDINYDYAPYIGGMYYDNITDKLFILLRGDNSNKKNLIKINCKTNNIESNIPLTNSKFDFSNNFGVDTVNRKLIMSGYGNYITNDSYYFLLIDLDTLTQTIQPCKLNKVNNAYIVSGCTPCYNKISDHYIYPASYANNFKDWPYVINRGNRYDFGTYPLPEVVRELCIRTGIPSDKIDTTDLNGIAVKGYVRANRTTCRSMLEMLSAIYNFDAVESFGTIKFVKRGKDSVATISWEELGAKIYSNNQPAQDIFKSTRTQEIDLPKVANILYYDRDKDYAQNTQESKRVIETTENVYTLETPAVLVPNEAKQIIDRVMYQTWTARDKYQFQTNMDYAALEPTDVIKVAKGDMTYSMRITKKDESQGVCKYEAEAEDKTVYDQNGEGDSGLKPDQNITVTSDTSLILLDIPIFDKSDDNSGMYALFEKTDPKGYWKGAVIYKSQTTNGNFSQIDGSGAFSTTGGCLTALPDWNGVNTINYSDSVVVELLNGELEGISEDDILNGHNLCVIGNEVLQFKEAVFIDTNTYRLSGFLRARFGTEQWAINHTTADRFALLEFDQSKIMRINKNDSMFGVEKYYKSVTLGKKIADAPIIPFTNQGNGYKPYAVNNIIHNIKEDGSYNFQFDYRGRGRVTFDDTIPVDIDGDPSFEVDILDSKSKIVRTILTKTNSFYYTAEQQKEDFGATTNNFSLNIYKLNNIIGRGFAKSYSI